MQNAFTLLQSIVVPGGVSYTVREFKQRVTMELVQPLLDMSWRLYSLQNITRDDVPAEAVREYGKLNGLELNVPFENDD